MLRYHLYTFISNTKHCTTGEVASATQCQLSHPAGICIPTHAQTQETFPELGLDISVACTPPGTCMAEHGTLAGIHPPVPTGPCSLPAKGKLGYLDIIEASTAASEWGGLPCTCICQNWAPRSGAGNLLLLMFLRWPLQQRQQRYRFTPFLPFCGRSMLTMFTPFCPDFSPLQNLGTMHTHAKGAWAGEGEGAGQIPV